jgi:hypothetical protein
MLIQSSIQTALLTRVKDNSPTEHQTRFYVKLEQQNWMDRIRRHGVKDRTLSFGRSMYLKLSRAYTLASIEPVSPAER